MRDDFFGTLGSARPLTESPLERPLQAVKGLVWQAPSSGAPPGRALRGLSATPAPRAAVEPPEVLLQDMTLPREVLAVVQSGLGELDLHLEIAEMKHPVMRKARAHRAANGSFSAYLLHFGAPVLEDARWASEVLARGFLFRRGDNVRVLSEGCRDPDPAFEFAWRSWSDQGISTEYVEWRLIERLRRLQEEERADLLRVALRLPESVQRRSQRGPLSLLEDADLVAKLATLIGGIGENSGTDVNLFVNNRLIGVLPSDLRADRSEWGTSHRAAARSLLAWAADKGQHPTRKGYSCLAAVLVAFLDGQGIDDCKLIVETLERFRLITIDSELALVRVKYVPQEEG